MTTFFFMLMVLPFLVGCFTIFLCWRFLQAEVTDSSNVFNPVRVIWFAMTKPGKLVEIWPWIEKDEGQNLP